jgi:hypothetical protein
MGVPVGPACAGEVITPLFPAASAKDTEMHGPVSLQRPRAVTSAASDLRFCDAHPITLDVLNLLSNLSIELATDSNLRLGI